MTKNRCFLSHLGLALFVTALTGCSGNSGSNTYVGYVEADWLYVSAPQSGWIETRPADEGQKVSPGDVLFTMDDDREQAASAEAASRVQQATAQARDIATGARAPEIRALEAQLEEANAALRLAGAERDRIAALVVEGIASRQQEDEAEAALRTAKARVARAREQVRVAELAGRPASREAARANVQAARATRNSAEYALEQRTIRAKVPAEVSEVFLQPGEFAKAGNPVLSLLPGDGLKVRFFVNQTNLPAYKIGTEVSVSADGLKEPVKGKVSYISADAEYTPPVIYSKDARDKLVFLVEAKVPADAGLKPGLPVDVAGP